MLRWPRPVSFVNGRVVTGEGVADSIRFSSKVLACGGPSRAGDAVVDLAGAFVLPGLINAHDHLELNHYGRLRPGARYDNVSQWIDDLRPLIRDDPAIRRKRAYPLRDRLFIGGLKNLLAGVTTVAHHNPFYREIDGHMPVRLVRRLGWAHSLALEQAPVGANGEPGGNVRKRYLGTSARLPFVLHAGEGVDAAAAEEIHRLEQLGCVKANTVIVHGVALTRQTWRRMIDAGAGLVWCPASNDFLFGRTVAVHELLDIHPLADDRICLGTDSRLTGSRDLLEEMRVASRIATVSPGVLLRMVTTSAAAILRLKDGGRIRIGSPADLIVVPSSRDTAAESLLETRRQQVSLVAIAGRPMVAGLAFRDMFAARGVTSRCIIVDGEERLASERLARDIDSCTIREEGVACS